MTNIEISSIEEAKVLFECAKLKSSNWKLKKKAQKFINNRSHFMLRIMLYKHRQQRVSNLHIVDLAGYTSNNMSVETRKKLGSDAELNAIRIGLTQFKSIV